MNQMWNQKKFVVCVVLLKKCLQTLHRLYKTHQKFGTTRLLFFGKTGSEIRITDFDIDNAK